jgi:predicted metal-binding protein
VSTKKFTASDNKKDRMERLVKIALENGATRAKLIKADQVVVDQRVPLKCLVPRCNAYGRSLTCPPNSLPIEKFIEILSHYHHALIVQVESDQNSLDRSEGSLGSTYSDLLKGHLALFRPFRLKLLEVIERVEAGAFKQGYAFAAGFAAGSCPLCGDECPGIMDGRCRHPFRARPAMEAVGIDIVKTAREAGFSVELSSGSAIKYTGLILIF